MSKKETKNKLKVASIVEAFRQAVIEDYSLSQALNSNLTDKQKFEMKKLTDKILEDVFSGDKEAYAKDLIARGEIVASALQNESEAIQGLTNYFYGAQRKERVGGEGCTKILENYGAVTLAKASRKADLELG